MTAATLLKSSLLLTRGNRKLGDGIHVFSLPAVMSCPGATPLCIEHCYGQDGRFRLGNVKARLASNWERLLAAEDFVGDMLAEIRCRRVATLRVHVVGDFFSPEYAANWREIARRSKQTKFFAYTRSWRIPEILPELTKLGRLSNFALWFSTDRESGPAPQFPGIRYAHMHIDAIDDLFVPPETDLVFLDKPPKHVRKRIDAAQVCPYESGIEYPVPLTCTSCGLCWNTNRRLSRPAAAALGE